MLSDTFPSQTMERWEPKPRPLPPPQRDFKPVKRNWMNRNPRLFASIFITTSMLILFSRPIYDAFIRDDLLPSPSGKLKRF